VPQERTGRLSEPLQTIWTLPIYHGGQPSWGRGVRVKVERIRDGRRLPDVEYIETRAPRRRQTDKREPEGFRAPSAQADGAATLRLPWKVNRRSD
jgi:hypothetical protein